MREPQSIYKSSHPRKELQAKKAVSLNGFNI
jgi:hypothetical protein